jgi:hypothetical protein
MFDDVAAGISSSAAGDIFEMDSRMQRKKARRRALCGTLSTFLLEDEVGGVRSQPQQRGILLRALSAHF